MFFLLPVTSNSGTVRLIHIGVTGQAGSLNHSSEKIAAGNFPVFKCLEKKKSEST